MNVALAPSTIADRTYERLRTDIIFDRLVPGAKLRLDRLADSYGASVSTLREVLNRLASEGLVHAAGQRGFEVAAVSSDGFRDVAGMRLLLETHALPKSFAAGDLEWESQVVAAHHKLKAMERRMMAGEPAETELWKRYDREFHQALISACGSQTLIDLFSGVFDHYLRYQMVAVVFRGSVANDEHEELLQCALTRDAVRACAVLTRHVQECVAFTIERNALPAGNPSGASPVRPGGDPFADGESLTVSDDACRRIRSAILFGHLPPGSKLKLEKLKADYGVSVSTLREILNRLTSERLVVAEGQKGFEVAPVSIGNLRELADLRLLLECHALERSFAAGDMEWEGQVVAAHHRLAHMEDRMAGDQRGASELWKQYDWQFHQALISACGSRMLVDTHAAVFDKYLRYQMIALSYRGDLASDEHRAMLDSAVARDAGRACDVLRRHVAGGMEHALLTGAIG